MVERARVGQDREVDVGGDLAAQGDAKRFDALYEEFTAQVAQGRKLPAGAIDSVARGRVFTGAEALQLGLVDAIGAWGTIDDVRARVDAHVAAGADHVCIQVLGSSLVEVPEGAVDEVLWAMRRTTIKGKKATVRRERFDTR